MASIDAYFERFSALNPTEKLSHFREDYREEDDDWVEYLDYLDEMRYEFKHHLQNTKRDFIYRYYALRNQTFECDGHTHTFHSDPSIAGDIYIPTPHHTIDQESCWWKKFSQHDALLAQLDDQADAAKLTSTEHAYLAKLAGLRMALSSGIPPPSMITFKGFQEQWNLGSTTNVVLKRLAESEPIWKIPLQVIEEIKESAAANPPNWVPESRRPPRVIRTNTDVFEDHGFHQLMMIHKSSQRILSAINKIRSSTSPPITGEDVALGMIKCAKCNAKEFAHGITSPGFYYAPPGSGKSTALQNGTFVGVDTDWLIYGSDYQTVVCPFIMLGVAVLTNQYHLAIQAPERVFGMFNKDILRNDVHGNPYTSLREILLAKQHMRSDIFLIFTNKYFSDVVTTLQRAHYIYDRTRQRFFNKTAQRPTNRPPISAHGKREFDTFILEVSRWSGTKKKKRKKELHALLDSRP